MDDYLSKPFSEEQLRQLLVRWEPKAKPADGGAAVPAVTSAKPGLGEAAVPVSAEAIAEALDMGLLQGMQKTHPALVARLIDTYMSYGPKAIQQLLAALVSEDIAKLKMTAHSLKSSSANIGAMHLSALCRELEARLKDESVWEAGRNLAAVADIESAFQAVAAALEGLRSQLQAAAPAVLAKARA